MADKLETVKSFLGKYYPELNYSCLQEKYSTTGLDTIFDQRFLIQSNKAQMIVDPFLTGLIAIISGNEIHISKALYDHPGVVVSNSLENKDQSSNPRSLYNPETFSTLAYLVCQNHTSFRIVGEVDEPIYLTYRSDYETFYNSVIVVEVDQGFSVDVVEEIESCCAMNAVMNYVLHPESNLNLRTFYRNHVSAISYLYRNIVLQHSSSIDHVLFGRGSSNIIDENKVLAGGNSVSSFKGIVRATKQKFHSILYIQPGGEGYSVNVDYRDVISGDSDVTFFPVIMGDDPGDAATISVSNICIDDLVNVLPEDVRGYIQDIADSCITYKVHGLDRFNDNKVKFLDFP